MEPLPLAHQSLSAIHTHRTVCLYSTKRSTVQNLSIDDLEMRPITAKELLVRLSQTIEANRAKIKRNEEQLERLTAKHPVVTPNNRLDYMRTRNRIMKNLRIQRHVLKKSLNGLARTHKHLEMVYDELKKRGVKTQKNVYEVSGGGGVHGDIGEVPQADCSAQRDSILSSRKTPPVPTGGPGSVSQEHLSEAERRVYLFCGQGRPFHMRVFPF